MDNTYDKRESENKGSDAGNTEFAEAFDCKITAVSILQHCFIVIYYT